VIFGDRLQAAPSAEPAAWLSDASSLSEGTVGGLLPRHYESYLLLESADSDVDDWWAAQSELVSTLAGVLTDFTTTPERSWFAIWEGHGYDGPEAITFYRDADPARVAALIEEENRRAMLVRDALEAIPRFVLPHRTYYLLAGHTLDVAEIRWPAEPRHWFRPDLWWPEDRSWFVGTDVDFWCNYIGGTEEMTDAVAARLPGLCRRTTLDEPLRSED
jgi:hypothetical protein